VTGAHAAADPTYRGVGVYVYDFLLDLNSNWPYLAAFQRY